LNEGREIARVGIFLEHFSDPIRKNRIADRQRDTHGLRVAGGSFGIIDASRLRPNAEVAQLAPRRQYRKAFRLKTDDPAELCDDATRAGGHRVEGPYDEQQYQGCHRRSHPLDELYP
jgi:hypothetical protein